MYHMYIGRFERNADVKGDPLIMSDFIFTRIESNNYNERLKEEYEKYLKESG